MKAISFFIRTGEYEGPDKIGILLKKATFLKDSNDWNNAIRILKKVKKKMIKSSISYPHETWCKYPLYLQQAGKYEESIQEFNFLLNDLNRRAQKEAFLDDSTITTIGKKEDHFNLIMENGTKIIQGKMVLAQKREQKKAI
jgi:hypothetical protein